MSIGEFERKVLIARAGYRIEKHNEPKYIVMNQNTLILISGRVGLRRMFGLVDKKIYKGLYIAIDNELENYDFVILG